MTRSPFALGAFSFGALLSGGGGDDSSTSNPLPKDAPSRADADAETGADASDAAPPHDDGAAD